MKKHLLIIIFALLLSPFTHAQYMWTQKATFGGPARHRAVGLTIGNRGYMGLGHINSTGDQQFKDWWEYDPGTNSWTQKADFGGGKRYHATGFAIGNKAYVGTGRDTTFNNRNDWWEYDPVTNQWSQKASLPSSPRRGAVSFAIGTKGYVGTGSGYSDFWEYNPATNSWAQKASLPASGRTSAVGFSIGNKGYIGTGDIGGSTNDFWEYDPATNAWTPKPNVPGPTRMEAGGFSLNGKGYIGTGDNFSSGDNYGDFYCYDPSTSSWTQIADFGGTSRRYLTCFTIGSRAYAGLGTNGTNFQDLWEYGLYNAVEETGELNLKVTVYPNPVTTSATISVQGAESMSNPMKLMLYDVQGKAVKVISLGSSITSFDKSGLRAGTYVYHVIRDNSNGQKTSIASGNIIVQ